MKVAMVGAGPGGLAIAAEFAKAGHAVTLTDIPEFHENVLAVADRGGVALTSGWTGENIVEVDATRTVERAVKAAEVVVVSVPAFVHEQFIELVVPDLLRGASLLFVGGGGGALAAWRVLRQADRQDVIVGETNCLPYIAKLSGPGVVSGYRKVGGVLLATIPAHRTAILHQTVREIWPFVERASDVWETTLINYDAIDVVPVAVTNAAILEARSGGMLLWGEGATRSVVRLIESLDEELLNIRFALGCSDRRRYRDFLVAQGLAPDIGDLFDVMRAGGIMRSVRPSGNSGALAEQLALEVPWTLVLAASLGRTVGVPTPIIDGLVAISAVLLGEDVWRMGPTLASLGLGGLLRDELRSYARRGE